MSYILDALKKSEVKRAEKQAPFQLQSHPSPPAAVPKRTWSRLWILFWLIIIAFPLSYPLYTHFTMQYSRNVDTTIAETAGADLQEKEPEIPAADAAEVEQSGTIPELRPVNNKKYPGSAVESGDVFEPAPLGVSRASLPSLPSSEQFSSVPYLDELESPFRESVPEFKLAGHVYANDPALRLILINNRIVREKDVVAKDYILEEITPKGVIFRSGDIRFRMDGY
ncbi:general secretion pathway protein GspB [Desulfopila inferna]|uniref:general secretion pathway protein GspB n=1 Tax=Desulfopila inferna TaxID=468528 RepID=UPI0019646A01|nr:general secretion pathway protein GspB [Desulfopila inferna]MBM9606303.1 general secretion pathway protein GspB [Desulfopila inferna]